MIKYFIYNEIPIIKCIFSKDFFSLYSLSRHVSRYLFTFLEPRKSPLYNSDSVTCRVISRSFRYERGRKDKLTCDIKRHWKKYDKKTRPAKMTMASENFSCTM